MMDDGWQEKNEKCFVFPVQTSSIYCMVCWWVLLVLTFALKTPTKEESLSHRYKSFLLPLLQTQKFNLVLI
jgi:hypothetical protein